MDDAGDFNPDAFIAQAEGNTAPQQGGGASIPGFDPDAFISDASAQKYGTPGQMAKTAVEGAAEGVLGPLAPLIETKVLGVNPEDIRGRHEENPLVHGGANALGFVGSAVTGVGEAALLGKLGKAAVEGAGLAQATSFGAKVGSAAVQQAVEMAVMQGGDEVSKMVLHDPEQSAQTAIANMGMAAALGAGGGAIFGGTGALWSASGAGQKLEGFLNTVKDIGSDKLVLPDKLQEAAQSLGLDLHPNLVAALSGNETAKVWAQDLYRDGNKAFLSQIDSIPEHLKKSVTDALNIPLEDVTKFSSKAAGDLVREGTHEVIDKAYGPIAAELDAIKAEAAATELAAPTVSNYAGKIMESSVGPQGPAPGSEYFKLYEDAAAKVLKQRNIGDLDKMTEELYSKATRVGVDASERQHLFQIKNVLEDMKANEISKQAVGIAGAKEGEKLGQEAINWRKEVRQNYGQYAKKMDELASNLGIGKFKGTGSLKNKLDDLSAEQIIKRFTTKGDVASAEFLKANLPEVHELVRQYEAKQFLSKAVFNESGTPSLDLKRLTKEVDKLMKGQPEHAAFVLNPEALAKIQAADVVNDALGSIKDAKSSEVASALRSVFGHFGASALGAVGYLMGHNPVSGAILGEVAQRLGKDAPEAIKMAMLTFMASEKGVSASGLHAATDFLHNVVKGEAALNKAVGGVFKGGSDILPQAKMPSDAARIKLDKLVASNQDNPTEQVQVQQRSQVGHYMPNHQTAMSATSTSALQYLQSIKPMPYKPSPLDAPIAPTPAMQERYHRALDIAQSPMVVLQHVKDGTLQMSDMHDLQAMYPALYKSMAGKLNNMIVNHQASDEPIPYKTRMGVSLFIGQPLDLSMTPQGIVNAQPKGPNASPGAQQQKPASAGSTKALTKLSNSYRTPAQTAEVDRSKRE